MNRNNYIYITITIPRDITKTITNLHVMHAIACHSIQHNTI